MFCENVDWSEIKTWWESKGFDFKHTKHFVFVMTIEEKLRQVARELGYQAGQDAAAISKVIAEKF